MATETVRMSSKGQIVIPQDIRKEMHADEGTLFTIMSMDNTLILKKLKKPSKEELLRELERISKEGRKHLENAGIKESDIPDIVQRRRHSA